MMFSNKFLIIDDVIKLHHLVSTNLMEFLCHGFAQVVKLIFPQYILNYTIYHSQCTFSDI